MLRTTRVAAQAARVNLFRGMLLEDKNLRFVSAARDVCCARSVAPFASLMRRSASGIERGLPMSGLLPAAKDVGMAGLASF
jgi:hypothetical protein